MTALIIISIIVAFIILLLLIPINLYIEYDGENVSVKLRYMFLNFSLKPGSQKKKQKKEKNTRKKNNEKPKDDEKEEKESESPFSNIFETHGVSGVLEILKEILNILRDFSNDVRKHILIRKLKITISAGGKDAFDVAMNFGYICNGVYPLIGALSALVVLCNIPDVNINADFDSKKTTASLFTQIAVRPMFLIKNFVFYAFKTIKLYMRLKGTENKSKETSAESENN